MRDVESVFAIRLPREFWRDEHCLAAQEYHRNLKLVEQAALRKLQAEQRKRQQRELAKIPEAPPAVKRR